MKESLKKIKVVMMDVDGVLTDGLIIVDAHGVETKNFDVQDGFGIVFLHKCGIRTAIISARESGVVAHRAKDLKIDKVCVGVYPKLGAYDTCLEEFKVQDEEVCFIGDDVADLAVMRRCGFAVAPANAVFEVKRLADYVTRKSGGRGAVRETVELILKAKGLWSPQLYEH
ncbi:MAG: HAD-IIIA family hydrolase [Candidatus Omnitrophica bacterium]|nr:HAD-IIIA family hydrolase [Candidatus Omnitrophota bacterium]MDE2213949.1 HAD-IIIA family hydrolase [Candidatus Omnitrophota bacterium]MDE2231901.1 HAD-IIIA family hydrolase [Candidatus Omnitrophota bacterium]